MKSKYLFPVTLAALMVAFQPAWASPFTSKSQNAAPADNTVVVEETAKKCSVNLKCSAKRMKHHPGMGHGGLKRFMKNMSADDRVRFKGILEKMKANPDVQAARDAVKSADSKDAKRAAFKKLYEARRATMSEEDRAFVDGLKQKMKANKDGKNCAKQCTRG